MNKLNVQIDTNSHAIIHFRNLVQPYTGPTLYRLTAGVVVGRHKSARACAVIGSCSPPANLSLAISVDGYEVRLALLRAMDHDVKFSVRSSSIGLTERLQFDGNVTVVRQLYAKTAKNQANYLRFIIHRLYKQSFKSLHLATLFPAIQLLFEVI